MSIESDRRKLRKLTHHPTLLSEDAVDGSATHLSPVYVLRSIAEQLGFQPPTYVYWKLLDASVEPDYIATVLVRGRYRWKSDRQKVIADAKSQAALRALEWYYSSSLHPMERCVPAGPPSLVFPILKPQTLFTVELDWSVPLLKNVPFRKWEEWKNAPKTFKQFFPVVANSQSRNLPHTTSTPSNVDLLSSNLRKKRSAPSKSNSDAGSLGVGVHFAPMPSDPYTPPPTQLSLCEDKMETPLPRSAISVSGMKRRADLISSVPSLRPIIAVEQYVNVYMPCPPNKQLIVYTPRVGLQILWVAMPIPAELARVLNIYTPCPRNMQVVKYTPLMSLEKLFGGRQRLIVSESTATVLKTSSDDFSATGVHDPDSSEQYSTTPASITEEPVLTGAHSDSKEENPMAFESNPPSPAQVQIPSQHMSQDQLSTLTSAMDTSDMEVDEDSEAELDDSDIEMEDDDGLDPTSESFTHTPGTWASMIGTSSSSAPETSMVDDSSHEESGGGAEEENDQVDEEADEEGEEEGYGDGCDDSDIDMDYGRLAGEDHSGLSPRANVSITRDHLSAEDNSQDEDSDFDTLSDPPSDFEEDDPFGDMGKEEGEDGGEGEVEDEMLGEDTDDDGDEGSSHVPGDDPKDPDEEDLIGQKGQAEGNDEVENNMVEDDMDEDGDTASSDGSSDASTDSMESGAAKIENDSDGEPSHNSSDESSDDDETPVPTRMQSLPTRTAPGNANITTTSVFRTLRMSEKSAHARSATRDSEGGAGSSSSSSSDDDDDDELPPARPSHTARSTMTTSGGEDEVTSRFRTISLGHGHDPPPSVSASPFSAPSVPTTTTTPSSSGPADSSTRPSTSTSTDKEISTDFSKVRSYPGGSDDEGDEL